MKRFCSLVFTCVFLLTISSVLHALCYPPAGTDYMPSSTATIELEINGMGSETVTVNGPTSVSRSSPYNPGDGRIKIDTEIISMSLTGNSIYIGPITIIESPSKVTNGEMQQQTPGVDFPADSFFDVYVEIHSTLPFPLSTLQNDEPVVMQAIISSIPPWGSIYTSNPTPIPLKNENDEIIGYINHGSHKIQKVGDLGGPPPATFFNFDGYVNSMDLALFLQCYHGTAPPEAMYLGDLGGDIPPQFFKCDGKVDGKDLALWLLCFKGLGPDP